MSYDTISNAWDDATRRWPQYVYIETTNKCNAVCKSCLNHRCKRTRGTMSLEDFKTIANKVRGRGLQIGALFCFGEPLTDQTLFEKFDYARQQKMLPPHIGFNTNVSLMTEEIWPKILSSTPNITLSFFNTGAEYENLTGLDWETSYNNAVGFIKYRDQYLPQYPIFIGCNTVKGHSLKNVKEAFKGHNVSFVQDAELRWGGSVITGVIDRMIMYNNWRCDGHKGALQIKYNGNCEYCAYDIIGTKDGGETLFGNILEDSWKELESKFRKKWKEVSTLCARCDYFYHAKDVIKNGFKKPNPLPSDWYNWQKPYLKEGESYAD